MEVDIVSEKIDSKLHVKASQGLDNAIHADMAVEDPSDAEVEKILKLLTNAKEKSVGEDNERT